MNPARRRYLRRLIAGTAGRVAVVDPGYGLGSSGRQPIGLPGGLHPVVRSVSNSAQPEAGTSCRGFADHFLRCGDRFPGGWSRGLDDRAFRCHAHHHRRGAFAVRRNATRHARRFFAPYPGSGRDQIGRAQHFVQHHDRESGATAGGGQGERAHAGRDRDRARSAGPALSQDRAGVRRACGYWGCASRRAWSRGIITTTSWCRWKARDRDRRRGRKGNFGGAV